VSSLTLIVAVADNGIIGKDGKLPWKIPEDLRFFKQTTMGHAIIMGRKTWDEVGKPLPGRRNIVVSRKPDLRLEGAEITSSLEDAIALAKKTDDDPFVIGGAAIFAAAIPLASKILLTEVHQSPDGDTTFPSFDRSAWRETARRKGETEGVEFVTLER
jgi:dihydrofolate reductase